MLPDPAVDRTEADTLRARFGALINWAALFLFREAPLRLDVSAKPLTPD